MSLLFSKTTLGPLTLQNRLVMAPMTRNRAIGNVPNELMAQYYAQRASAGLIITEGTSPSPNGLGYPRIPGIFSAAQVAGWKHVTDAVHPQGAKMFMQLMHCGRIAHPLNLPAGARVLAPSAVAAAGEMYTDAEGMKPNAMPRGDDRGRHQDRHRGIRPGGEERRGGGIRRHRAARRERLSARAVHPPELESAHGPLRRRDREPRALRARGRRCGDRRPSARTRSASACRRSACSTTCRSTPAMEADYTYLARAARCARAWSTSTSSTTRRWARRRCPSR